MIFFFTGTKTLTVFPGYALCNWSALIGVDSQVVNRWFA